MTHYYQRQEWFNCNIYVSAVCTRGMVRVEGGQTPAEGAVAVCLQNKWGQMCDTYWTEADTKVVCGQLGYAGKGSCIVSTILIIFSSDGRTVLGSIYYEPFTWNYIWGCRGNESIITACAFTTPMVTCTNYAGVSCYSKSHAC